MGFVSSQHSDLPFTSRENGVVSSQDSTTFTDNQNDEYLDRKPADNGVRRSSYPWKSEERKGSVDTSGKKQTFKEDSVQIDDSDISQEDTALLKDISMEPKLVSTAHISINSPPKRVPEQLTSQSNGKDVEVVKDKPDEEPLCRSVVAMRSMFETNGDARVPKPSVPKYKQNMKRMSTGSILGASNHTQFNLPSTYAINGTKPAPTQQQMRQTTFTRSQSQLPTKRQMSSAYITPTVAAFAPSNEIQAREKVLGTGSWYKKVAQLAHQPGQVMRAPPGGSRQKQEGDIAMPTSRHSNEKIRASQERVTEYKRAQDMGNKQGGCFCRRDAGCKILLLQSLLLPILTCYSYIIVVIF